MDLPKKKEDLSITVAPAYDEKRPSVVEEALVGELYDARYQTTKRGLKSRHAQMIALGGTIGTLGDYHSAFDDAN